MTLNQWGHSMYDCVSLAGTNSDEDHSGEINHSSKKHRLEWNIFECIRENEELTTEKQGGKAP